MDSSEDRGSQSRFSEDEVKQILRKAVELNDLRRDTWDESDLIGIASELGIEADVVRDAIAESQQLKSPTFRNPLTHRIEGALLAGFGAATFVPVAIWDSNALPAIVTVGVTSVMLALDSDEPRNLRRYLSRNIWLWSGFWAGGATRFDMGPDVTLMLVMGSPIVGGLLGMTLMKFLRRLRPTVTRGSGAEPLVTRASHALLRLLPARQRDDGVEYSAAEVVMRLAST